MLLFLFSEFRFSNGRVLRFFLILKVITESLCRFHSLMLPHDHLFPSLLQLAQEEGGGFLLQSLSHSLHSRERLIQVGEVMRGDRAQSCTHSAERLWLRAHWNVVCLWSRWAPLKWQHRNLCSLCFVCIVTFREWQTVSSSSRNVTVVIFSGFLC